MQISKFGFLFSLANFSLSPLFADTPPANTKLLWIKEDTHTICYYDGLKSAWVPTTSVWSEDANKKWNSSLNVFM